MPYNFHQFSPPRTRPFPALPNDFAIHEPVVGHAAYVHPVGSLLTYVIAAQQEASGRCSHPCFPSAGGVKLEGTVISGHGWPSSRRDLSGRRCVTLASCPRLVFPSAASLEAFARALGCSVPLLWILLTRLPQPFHPPLFHLGDVICLPCQHSIYVFSNI